MIQCWSQYSPSLPPTKTSFLHKLGFGIFPMLLKYPSASCLFLVLFYLYSFSRTYPMHRLRYHNNFLYIISIFKLLYRIKTILHSKKESTKLQEAYFFQCGLAKSPLQVGLPEHERGTVLILSFIHK